MNSMLYSDCEQIKASFNKEIAIKVQNIISKKVDLRDYVDINEIEGKVLVGLDASYLNNGLGIGVAVAIKYPQYDIIDCDITIRKVCIPYIPGLLAFREMYLLVPSLLNILKKVKPYVLFVDGHGYAHPRFAGIATHIGVVFNTPTIGVAKKRLVGEETIKNGDIYLKIGEKLVSKILLIKNKKIYISPGNKISLETSFNIAKIMSGNSKLPIPIYIADRISKIAKNHIDPNLDCKKFIDKIK
jgi:deoxyribonuclease V